MRISMINFNASIHLLIARIVSWDCFGLWYVLESNETDQSN